MKKLLSILALAAVALPSGVFARGTAYRFTRDGSTYVYTIKPASSGRQVIEGRRLPGGSAFRLVVDGDRVDGMSGGRPVSFRTSAGGAVTIAAR